MESLREDELNLSTKIDRYLNSNEIELLFDTNEILEAIAEIKILSDLYVDIHVQLKKAQRGYFP
jgi:hypothetical protein